MNEQIFVPIAPHYESSIARNGLHSVVSSLIAAEVGGLWQMCDCGFGRELMMPYRSCFVEGFERQLLLLKRGEMLSMLTLRFTIAASKAELDFEVVCRHDLLARNELRPTVFDPTYQDAVRRELGH